MLQEFNQDHKVKVSVAHTAELIWWRTWIQSGWA
ncbi:Trp operon leader peptide [Vibrio sonorensis]|nr:Trp operon leader peptide [Vibrio sonorensis]